VAPTRAGPRSCRLIPIPHCWCREAVSCKWLSALRHDGQRLAGPCGIFPLIVIGQCAVARRVVAHRRRAPQRCGG
jgi:hypothetical protein